MKKKKYLYSVWYNGDLLDNGYTFSENRNKVLKLIKIKAKKQLSDISDYYQTKINLTDLTFSVKVVKLK